jgi:membrane protease subunit HflK
MEQKKSSSGGGFGQPPRMEDVISKLKGAKGKFPVKGQLVIIALAIVVIAFSCFYTVDVDEVGVVMRFGRFVRITQPGLNFKLPKFIEEVRKVKVRYVFKEEFGFRTIEPGVRTRYAASPAYEAESLMLTGDLNVAIVPWIVQYRVKDPYNYLFKVRNTRNTLRDLAESSMRLVVGDRSINEVISKREEIATEAAGILQKELDEAETGIQIVTIEMKRTNVPEPVQPSFNEVNQAGQEKEKLIYQAKEEYNKVIPAALGEAEKTIKAAEGYALALINKAKGDASRFNDLYAEYAKAKEITKRRLYLEAMQEVYPKIGTKYLVDADVKGLLPLLDLGKRQGATQ